MSVNADRVQATSLGALEDALGAANVLSGDDDNPRYFRDWPGETEGRALAILRPLNASEVARAVNVCNELGLAIVPQGGHTGLVGGAMPDDPARQVVLSLERLNRIRSIDAADFSMQVESGCVLATVKEAADSVNCLFPLSLGAQGSCQIGGNIATNAGGVNVLRYGMMRELVLGLEVVLPDGRVWDGMSALRKDNRGVDLNQLFIGSEGTLGIITAATLKLFPKPRSVVTAFVGVRSVEDAIALYSRMRRDSGDMLSAFELLSADSVAVAEMAVAGLRNPVDSSSPWYVLVEVSTSALYDLGAVVEEMLGSCLEAGLITDGAIASSTAQAADFWAIREGVVEGQATLGRHLRTDVSVAISLMADFITRVEAEVERLCPGCRPLVYGHIGDGNVHFNVVPAVGLDDTARDGQIDVAEHLIFDIVDRFRGSISAEHGIGRVKRGAFLSRLSDEHRFIIENLKGALDPKGVLNPDCILPAGGAASSLT